MTAIYIKFYHPSQSDLPMLRRLLGPGYGIECLKRGTPDDGEALCQPGKYRIDCADDAWTEALEILKDSERGLVYSVTVDTSEGRAVVREAGEMNSSVSHYTTRLDNAKQLFAFWFEDELPSRQTLLGV